MPIYKYSNRVIPLLKGCILPDLNSTNRSIEINQNRFYSSVIFKKLEPYFATGLTDAEGSFKISISEKSDLKLGWMVTLGFSIQLHVKDLALLEKIKNYFGVGSISKRTNRNLAEYQLSSKEDLKIIIKHFDKYPLITQKRADYELWKQVHGIFCRKEHFTTIGFNKLLAIKSSHNRGLSEKLKVAFPAVPSSPRPVVELPAKLDER